MKTTTGIALSFLIAAAIALTGCSPTGWASKPMPDASRFEPGQEITVIQKDGSQTSGKFVGNADLEQSSYETSYNESIFHHGLDQFLPIIGERVQITTKLAENRIITGRLVGFDEVNMWLQPEGQSGPERVYIAAITGFAHNSGKYLAQDEFRNLFLDGNIPLRTAVVINQNGTDVQIPVNTISAVRESRGTAGTSSVASAFSE